MRLAPSSRAACTATSPTVPDAPSTSTRSVRCSPPVCTAYQPATPAMPLAAAATSSSPSGSTHRSASSATNRSAIEPTAFKVCTRVPGASDVPSTTRPMPSRPATNGGSGR